MRGGKTWLTSPIPMCPLSVTPSDTAMPADSCPRCCCAKSPWYVMWDASSVPHTPNSPHFSFFSYSSKISCDTPKGQSPFRAQAREKPHVPGGVLRPPPASSTCLNRHLKNG